MFPCFPFQTRYKTNEPVWEEAFTFLIHNPRSQELEVEVRRQRSCVAARRQFDK